MTRTLTDNYLENMAIRAAMSVSELLSVIWTSGTCHRIHLTDNLLNAYGLSNTLCSAVSVVKPLYYLGLFTLMEMSFLLPEVMLSHK